MSTEDILYELFQTAQISLSDYLKVQELLSQSVVKKLIAAYELSRN